MTFKDLKNKIKQEQKILALQIRRGKFLRKPCYRTDITEDEKRLYYSNWDNDFANWKVNDLSCEYRHRHIIYCHMFNNTPYDSIEKPHDDNYPDSGKLERIRKEWEGQIDEALRNCA